ncbi:helix-turn-helix transcriptional regulator [Azospirillum sp. A23]|uniref:helix-turn-helix domain-containing protein n=1 Tax=Azospirillum sp. A23 TaxID=3160608 RepID=UPI0036F2C9AD
MAPSIFDGLTRRQLEVLDLLAQGLSNQEIGERLGLNLSTVKTHVTGVLKRWASAAAPRRFCWSRNWGATVWSEARGDHRIAFSSDPRPP